MAMVRLALLLLALATAGCAELRSPAGAVGVDGVACVGDVLDAYANLSATDDTALPAKAQYPSGKGGVCAARAFVAAVPLVVYRVYDAASPGSMYGGWWALSRPRGPKDEYRAMNAICKEWSNLDRLVSCQVKARSEIVLGTTQSVDCPDGTVYPKTAAIQVYIPNDRRAGALYVENCHEEGVWP